MSSPGLYITDGISQKDRYPHTLDPGYFAVDERTTDDLLLFVTELSVKYNYYNEKNEIDGNWLDFFLTDANLMLRLLSSFDFKRYELEYNRNKQVLQNAVSRQEVKKKLTILIDGIYEFIFFQNNVLEKFKASVVATNSERLLNYTKYLDAEEIYRKARREFYSASIHFKKELNLKYIHEEEIGQLILTVKPAIPVSPFFEKGEASEFYENLNTAVIDVFDNLFSKFDIVYSQLKIAAGYFQQKKDQVKVYYKPQISLLLSFFELYQVLKKEMNLFTGKHLDFYYKQRLGIDTRKAEADKVSVILLLNKAVNELLLQKGEALLATIPGQTKKEIFRLKEDIYVNHTVIAELKSIYKIEFQDKPKAENDDRVKKDNPAKKYMIYAAGNMLTQVEDSTKKSSQNISWPLFGEDQRNLSKSERSMQAADIGLLISSPVLFAVDGQRVFNIKLQLNMDLFKSSSYDHVLEYKINPRNVRSVINPEMLNKAFIIDITGSDQWIRISRYQVTCQQNDPKDTFINIQFTLQREEAAVAVYKPGIHGSGVHFKYPVVKLMLNFNSIHNAYSFFQSQEIERVTIRVDVHGSTRLQMQNNTGRVSASNPFQLFGPVPAIGSYLDISNTNIFNRFTKEFKIKLKWDGIPRNIDGFSSYYAGYNNGITNGSFKVTLSEKLYDNDPANKKEQAVLDLFHVNNDDEVIKYLLNSTTLTHRDFLKLRFENELLLEEAGNPAQDFKTGTIRLELVAPVDAFGHQLYPVVFPKVLLHNSKWYAFKKWPTPNPPYAPVVNSVVVDYVLEHSEYVSGKTLNDKTHDIALCHIYPFGYKKIYPQDIFESIKFIPTISYKCNLFIGLKDLLPGKVLTLLFQLKENNFDKLEENQEPMKWHYLDRNRWQEIDKENILEDNTFDFKGTGIVKIIIPKNISRGNTLLNPLHYWLMVSCNDDNKSKVTGIFTQVVTAVRELDDTVEFTGPLTLDPFSITEFERTVPEIAALYQPFSSYHGKEAETTSRYYSRISESLRHKNRAVTATDIAQKILESFPDIYKVICYNNSGVEADELTDADLRVVVIPGFKKNEIDADEISEPKINIYKLYQIQNYLSEILSPVIKVNVCNPEYEKIKVICSVQFKNDIKYAHSGILKQTLNKDLRKFITPWQYSGELDINMNRGIFPAEILNFIKNQPYVEVVKQFNVVHFYNHTNEANGEKAGRLMESLYMNKGTGAGITSFIPNKPPAEMNLVIKASRPGAILVSSRQHLVTVMERTEDKEKIKKEVIPKSGIGRLVIGDEFLVMDPYNVLTYSGITQSLSPDPDETIDFYFNANS